MFLSVVEISRKEELCQPSVFNVIMHVLYDGIFWFRLLTILSRGFRHKLGLELYVCVDIVL